MKSIRKPIHLYKVYSRGPAGIIWAVVASISKAKIRAMLDKDRYLGEYTIIKRLGKSAIRYPSEKLPCMILCYQTK